MTFRIYAPRATEVTVSGEFEVGAPAHKLTKDPQGIWSVTVGPFEPEIYEYEFIVDGVQMLDPRNPMVKYNRGPAAISSLLDTCQQPARLRRQGRRSRQGRYPVLRLDDDTTDAAGAYLHAAELRAHNHPSARPLLARAIALDIGDRDPFVGTNRQLSEALTRLGIADSFDVYPGDHISGVRERFETTVLPFSRRQLATTAR